MHYVKKIKSYRLGFRKFKKRNRKLKCFRSHRRCQKLLRNRKSCRLFFNTNRRVKKKKKIIIFNNKINKVINKYYKLYFFLKKSKIDILINGAAGNFLAPMSKLSPGGFKTVIDIDLIGTYNTSKVIFEKSMKKNGGNIINISAGYYNFIIYNKNIYLYLIFY